MTKKDIARQISAKYGLTQTVTKNIVQLTLDCIIDALANGGRIELRNFGVFEIRERAPRRARNPRTGQAVQVPAKAVVRFKPGRKMKEMLT